MPRPHPRAARRARQVVPARSEPLEPRRLLSVAPAQPDLVDASDTGVSRTDNITAFDNSTAAAALTFLVADTVPGAHVTLYLDGAPASVVTADSTGALIALPANQLIPDRVHAVTARQTEPGGEPSVDSPALLFTVDTTRPPAPPPPDLQPASDTGARNDDDVTSDNTPTFDVVGAPYYVVYRDASAISSVYASGSNFTSPPTADGSGFAFTVVAVDAAGNRSLPSLPTVVTVDTQRPNAGLGGPLVQPTRGAADLTFSIEYSDLSALDPASLDGSDVRVTGPDGFDVPASFVSANPGQGGTRLVATYRFDAPGGTWDAADNGSYTFRLQPSQVSDLAGNFAASRTLGPLNVLLFGPTLAPDLLPASDIGSSSADDVTNFDNSSHDRALRFSVGNTFPGATVTIYADGTPIGIAVTEAGSAATVVTTNGTVPLPSGYYLITARQTKVGEAQSSASPPLGLTIDTIAPQRPLAPDLVAASDSGVSDADDVTNDNTPTFTVSLPLAPSFQVIRDGTIEPLAVGSSFTTPPLSDGVHRVAVVAVDTAGNVSEPSPELPVTIDTVAPPTPKFAGTLDTRFDGDGRFFLDGLGHWSGAVVQPDGKVLLAGGADGKSLVMRLNRDGTPDPTFGVGGKVAAGDENRAYLGLQSDGRIVLASTFSVTRLLPSGALDTSFGTNGTAAIDFPIRDLAVAADGRILVTGIVQIPPQQIDRIATTRLTADGQPDTTFGGTGRVVTPGTSPGIAKYAFSVAAAPDGKVVVAGNTYSAPGGSDVVFLVRYNADGTPDTSFGQSGSVTQALFNRAQAQNVDVAPDGRLLISGMADDGTGAEADVGFLERLNPDGSVDRTFDGDGLRTLPGIRSEGGWLGGGDAFLATGVRGNIALANYDPSGAVNVMIPGGYVVSPSQSTEGFALANYAVSPDDTVLLIGNCDNSDRRLAAYRLYGYTFGVPDLQADSDSGRSSSDNLTNDSTPTFDVAPPRGEAGLYQRVYRDGGRVSGAYEPLGAYMAPTQPDGIWSYSVGFVDAAGNASAAGPALSVHIDTTPPQVTQAFAGSSAWSPTFNAFMNPQGRNPANGAALMPAGDSPAPLPWSNLDTFTLHLSEPVSVAAGDLRLTGADGDYAPAAFTQDATNPSWKLSRPLGADGLLLALADTVTDGAGNRLAAAPAGGASGGTGPSPFQLRVNVLPGDADRGGAVTLTDQVLTRARFGATVGSTAGLGARSYTPFNDFNGDGRIDAVDLAVARSRVSARLPPSPLVLPPPAPESMPAPTAAPTIRPLNAAPRRVLTERRDVLG